MSESSQWTIQINCPSLLEICAWINDLGGPTAISFTNLFNLIQHFVNQTQVTGYNFIPTFTDVYGTIQYWNGNISGGNTTTGCVF